MRFFEIGICITVVATVLFEMIDKEKKKNYHYISLLMLLPLFLLHNFFEGIRWQMTGPYLYIVNMLFKLGKSFTRKEVQKKRIGKTVEIFWVFFIVFSILFVCLFPINSIPKPSGIFQVGTISYDLVDHSRKEIYGHDLEKNRKIRVQVWYPTDDISKGQRAMWNEDGNELARSLSRASKTPAFLLDHTGLIKSNSYHQVELSEVKETYPVILISHGWTGYRQLHTDLGEMLASHGYIAISTDHTYGAITTVFEDGEVVRLDVNALVTDGAHEELLKDGQKLVDTYSLDDKLVLNHLFWLNNGVLNNDEFKKEDTKGKVESYNLSFDLGNDQPMAFMEMFKNHIDLDYIGAVGHSTGGGGLVKLAINDSRVKAVFGMDPWVEPVENDILLKGLQVPSLFLRSEEWEGGTNDQGLVKLVKDQENPPLIYQINGSTHQEFSMLYMYEPVSRFFGRFGEIDSHLNATIQQRYILEFFNQHIQGMDADVEAIENDYEEVVEVEF